LSFFYLKKSQTTWPREKKKSIPKKLISFGGIFFEIAKIFGGFG
jgi:hypothetical protein